MQSKSGSLNSIDWKKIGVGALIATGSALITYGAQAILQINFGVYTPFVNILSAVAINAARKYLQGVQAQETQV